VNSLKLAQHINSLADISDIMRAMKYLSQIEINKLSRYIAHQKRATLSIELAAIDFLSFHPELMEDAKRASQTIIVLGSERGFCGNYNAALQQSLVDYLSKPANANLDTRIISVGYKLHNKFKRHPQLYSELSGPRLTEEIPDIISELISKLTPNLDKPQAMTLLVLHHDEDNQHPVFRNILPAFQSLDSAVAPYTTPPLTNIPKIELFSSLVDEYLFALLNQVFYAAFMAENQYRIRHVENAINKINEKISGLSLKRNEARQEEITEELEVIMLSSSEIEPSE